VLRSHTLLAQLLLTAHSERAVPRQSPSTVGSAPLSQPHVLVALSQVVSPEHVSPQSTVPEQPSEMMPHVAPASWHVRGTHAGVHDARCGWNGT
jgi:hypothetical protein